MTALHRSVWIVAMLHGLAACGESVRLTEPSPGPVTGAGLPPPQTRNSQGYVLDTAARRLAAAEVELLEGTQTIDSTRSDHEGHFSLTGTGSLIRVSSSGFTAATRPVSAVSTMIFYLAPLEPPVDAAGRHTLTIIADSACADLPEIARTRRYSISITRALGGLFPAGTLFDATVSESIRPFGVFGIGVAGRELGLWMGADDDPSIVEPVAENTYVAIGGSAIGSMTSAASGLTTSFDGLIEYCALTAPMVGSYECAPARTTARAKCVSRHHRLVMTPR